MGINLIIKQIPLFATLTEKERAIISDKVQLVEYKKGQTIYHEGDFPNAFFCVLSGRVVVSTSDRQGKETILEYLHRGKYFGIISLLTAEPHSVTAQAMNDSLILKIDKNDFDNILRKIPVLAIDLSLTLSRRLKRKDLHQKTIFESTVLSVFSCSRRVGKTVYVLNLALSLKKETEKAIVLLDIGLKGRAQNLSRMLRIKQSAAEIDLSGSLPCAEELKGFICKDDSGLDLICVGYQSEDETTLNKLLGILSILVNDYHYLILELPTELDKAVFDILNQSDLIHLISGPDSLDLKKTGRLITRLREECEFKPEKIKVIVNDYRLSNLDTEGKEDFLKHAVFATLPKITAEKPERLVFNDPHCEYVKVVRRIARQLGECTLGLALGVGAAYGLCHIGVLKVIEQEKISLDMISGSSIGALIAAFWAAGYSAKEIGEIAAEFNDSKLIFQLLDLTFPRSGFIKGYRIHRLLKKYLNNKTFYDLKLPLKIFASNVRTKDSVVIEKGSLVDAVMASCAMPGVFRPVALKEELLFDGGVLRPLPVEALVKSGIKKIIAVNVTPSREDLLKGYEKMKNSPQGQEKNIKRRFGLFGFKWYIKDLFKVNILDFIFGSIEIMQSEIATKEAALADIVLHPDTSGLNWLEFHKVREFIKRGEDEAERQLEKIRQLIKE